MKTLSVGAFLIAMTTASAWAQQAAAPPAQQAAPACLTQYTPLPGRSASAMIAAGYDIKAAVPNGLWLQKDREVFYCNSGRPVETEALCWRLREAGPC